MLQNYKSTKKKDKFNLALSELSELVESPQVWAFVITLLLGMVLNFAAKAQELSYEWPIFLRDNNFIYDQNDVLKVGQLRSVWHDETNEKMYFGGDFKSVGFQRIGIAVTDDEGELLEHKINLHNTSVALASVSKIIDDGDNGLFVLGQFTMLNGEPFRSIIRYDKDLNQKEFDLEFNIGGQPMDMLIHNDILYVCGSFTTSQGLSRQRLLAYNLLTDELVDWNPGVSNNTVDQMTIVGGDKLVVMGSFTAIGATNPNIAAFDISDNYSLMTNFNPLFSNGMAASSRTNLVGYENKLFVTGRFVEVNGQARHNLVEFEYDDDFDQFIVTDWEHEFDLSSGGNFDFTGLHVKGDRLYVAGGFDEVEAVEKPRLAALDLTDGNALVSGFSPPDIPMNISLGLFRSIFSFEDKIGIRASHTSATIDGMEILGSIIFNESDGSLADLQFRTNNQVRDVFPINGDKYLIGGDFNMVDVFRTNSLAVFDLNTWKFDDWKFDLNLSTTHTSRGVHDLLITDGKLYAAGRYSHVEGNTMNGLAIYDIDTKTLTTTTNFFNVSTAIGRKLLKYGSHVYLGGVNLTNASNRKNLLRFNATAATLDESFTMDVVRTDFSSGDVHALEVYDDKLYIGGIFDEINSEDGFFSFAAYDLIEDELLTVIKPEIAYSTASFHIRDIVKDGTKLYVAGSMDEIEGEEVKRLAEYDLTTNTFNTSKTFDFQQTAGYGFSKIAVNGDKLYVVGNFLLLSPVSNRYLARFNRSDFSVDTDWNIHISNNLEAYGLSIYEEELLVYGAFGSIGNLITNDTYHPALIGVSLVEPPHPLLSITSFNPTNESENVSPTQNITINFNTEVYQGSNASARLQMIKELPFATVQIDLQTSATQISGWGTTQLVLNFDPEEFEYDNEYKLYSYDGFFENGDGVAFDITMDSYSFSTLPVFAATSISPEHESVDVAVDANITITFNRAVYKGTNPAARFDLSKELPFPTSVFSITVDDARVTGWGSTEITVDPGTLEYGNTYDFITYNGFFIDEYGTELNISQDTEFTVVDETLQIVSLSPVSGSNIEHTIFLELDFSSPIEIHPSAPANIFVLKRYDNDEIFTFANKANATIIDETKLRIRLNADPTSNTYYVEFVPNSIREVDGEVLDVSGFDKDYWTFTTDWEYLSKTFSPESFSTFNLIDGDLKIIFEEDVKEGYNANFTLRLSSNNSIIESFNQNSELLRFEGNEVYFELNHLLEYGETYHISMSGGGIRSLDEIPTQQFNDNVTWRFRMEPDPELFAQAVSFSPTHESTNVSAESKLEIEFSHPVSFSAGGISLYNRETDSFIKTINNSSFSLNGNIVSIDPGDHLPYDTEIAVRILLNTFISEEYNVITIADNDTWYFTTAEPEYPQVVELSPVNGADDVSSNPVFEITFDRPMYAGIGANSNFIVIRRANTTAFEYFYVTDEKVTGLGSNKLTITPSSAFVNGESYYIEIPADIIKDEDDIHFQGITDNSTWVFTIDNFLPVEISELWPENGDESVAWYNAIEIQFNQEVSYTGGNGKIRLKNYANNGTVVSFQAAQISVLDDGLVEIGLPEGFFYNHNTKYFLEIDGDAFKNDADDFFEGFSDKDDYTFTATWEMPEVTQFSPANHAENAQPGQAINITFNRDIELQDEEGIGAGAQYHIRLRQTPIGGSTVNTNYWIDDSAISYTGNTLTINPAEPIDYATEVNVLMLNNVVMGIEEDNGETSWTGPLQGANIIGFYTFTTEKEPQSISFEALEDVDINSLVGNVILEANTSSGLEVSFEVVSGPANLVNGNELELTGTGTVVVRATQSGNNRFAAAGVVERIFNVFDGSKENQTIAFEALPAKTFGDETFELSAMASSGLPVSWTSSDESVAAINGNTLTILGAGSTTITASQSGNDNYNPASPVQQVLTVTKADQLITIEDITDKTIHDAPFDIVASASSGLDLSYVLDGPASISGSTITLEGTVGTVNITIRQAGNENYKAAEVTLTFEVVDEAELCNGFEVSVAAKTDVSCHGGADGSISLSITGGVAPYTIIWEHGGDLANIDALVAGSYVATVQDSNGCGQIIEVSIGEAEALQLSAEIRASHHTLNNGFIHVEVKGGIAPYQYAWSNGESTANLDNVAGGNYSLLVTDANGCTISENFELPTVASSEQAMITAMIARPNPFSDVVKLEVSQQYVGKRILIVNLHGQVVAEQSLTGQHTVLRLGQLTNGMYLIRVEGAATQLKLIKR